MTQHPPNNRAKILIVDDQEANIGLLRRILARDGYEQVRSTTDGREAAAIFADYKPDLVLLDLHMPNRDGFQVLEDLGPAINNGGYFPVLMLTGDASVEAKRGALSLGAKDFLAKPFDATEVMLRIRNLLETRFLYLSLENQNSVLETRVEARTRELMDSQIEILERLARAAEIRDDDTGRHTQRVGQLSSNIGNALGLPGRSVELLRRVAPLHDVGKIGIPDSILRKPGTLTEDELAVMRTHTLIGAQILSGGQSDLVMVASRIALSHHEWWNGAGYPHGISGDQIPIEARIVAVADVFDAVTHSRPYRAAWPMDVALRELERKSGSHFDPDVIKALLRSECYKGPAMTMTPNRAMRAVGWPRRSRLQ
ncbi:MAG TPA: HD domain-containing phosphohydrolase [Gemmatimonadaceae bacterium]|jgi:putative two-component system response regulator